MITVEKPEIPSIKSEKKVRFAVSPVVCKSVPWVIDANEVQGNGDLETLITEPNLFGLESSLKNDFAQLRTPYNNTQPSSCFAILIVVFCLIFLFSLIWWIADKLLMIEVEEQVSNVIAQKHEIIRN